MSIETQAVAVLTTGGTIDKVYFDANSEYAVGASVVDELLKEAHVDAPYRVVEVLRKDSLELDDDDRAQVAAAIINCVERCVIVTHGTDTMTKTAASLASIEGKTEGKTIVLTGALSPARFARSDATFNVGMAFAAVQTLTRGVYIVMNGQVFESGQVEKDSQNNVFVRC